MLAGGLASLLEDRGIGVGDDLPRCGVHDHELFFDSERDRRHRWSCRESGMGAGAGPRESAGQRRSRSAAARSLA